MKAFDEIGKMTNFLNGDRNQSQKPEEASVSSQKLSDDDFISAWDYCEEELAIDSKNLLRKKPMTKEMKNFLRIMVTKEEFRKYLEFLLKREEYETTFCYVDPISLEPASKELVDKYGGKLVLMGYSIHYYRKGKNGEEIAGASLADIAEYRQSIKANKPSDAGAGNKQPAKKSEADDKNQSAEKPTDNKKGRPAKNS